MAVRFTPRLRLEPIAAHHADDLYRLYQDPVIAYWYAVHWTHAQAETYAQDCAQAWERDGIHKWIAYHREEREPVGRGGLSRLPLGTPATEQIAALMANTNWHADRLEVGWAVRSERQRQGYATELASEALLVARHVLEAGTVIAFTEVHNLASRGVMERIGMYPVGEIRGCGLIEGQDEVVENAPFAVYAAILEDHFHHRSFS